MKKSIAALILVFMALSPAQAETIRFKEVLDKAIKNSYDLKISQTDIKISQTQIKEAKSEYFPTIGLGYNAQNNRDLTDGTSAITAVGDTTVMNNTSYQNALSAGLQYNVFDFGARGKKLDIAKKDKKAKQTAYTRSLRDLKIGLADAYTKALLVNRELQSNEELLELNKTLFSMDKSLYNAGMSRKTDMTDQALKVAVLINKIDDLKTESKHSLSDLSYYTGEDYTPSARILNIVEEEGFVPVSNLAQKPIKLEISESDIFNIEKFPEYKEYQLEIEKKRAELSVLKRQNLPQVKFYTNYYFYGTDSNGFGKSFSDMQSRSIIFRLSSTLPAFDGFKNQAQRERAKLEIERLTIERDKKVQSIKKYYEKIYDEAKDMPQKLENQSSALKITEDKIAMLDKLNQQQLIDKISYLKQKADLITQKFELEKTKINNEVTSYKIKILAESEEEILPQNNAKKKISKPKLQNATNKKK